MTDVALAAGLAATAGRLLLDLRDGPLTGKALGAAGDREAHRYLLEQLGVARPTDAVLSEEGADSPVRLGARRVWIVDPLDGTREYGEPGRSDWAVHVALWEDGELAAGAVALPAQDRVLRSDRPPALSPVPHTPPRVVVSRSRATDVVLSAIEAIGGQAVPLGSAGAKAAAVISGEAEAYLHTGGQYEWDSAAPVAVAQAAGLHCSRINGSPLAYNQPDPRLPDLLVCRPELAAPLLAAVEPA